MLQLRARACLAIWLRVSGNCSQSSAVPGQSSSSQDRALAARTGDQQWCRWSAVICASEQVSKCAQCNVQVWTVCKCALRTVCKCPSVQVCTVCKARDLVVCARELHSRCLGILLSVSWLELVSKQLFSPKQKSLSLLRVKCVQKAETRKHVM